MEFVVEICIEDFKMKFVNEKCRLIWEKHGPGSTCPQNSSPHSSPAYIFFHTYTQTTYIYTHITFEDINVITSVTSVLGEV